MPSKPCSACAKDGIFKQVGQAALQEASKSLAAMGNQRSWHAGAGAAQLWSMPCCMVLTAAPGWAAGYDRRMSHEMWPV